MALRSWVLIVCFMPLALQAAVYQKKGPDGVVTYTDRPSPGATKVNIVNPSISTRPTPRQEEAPPTHTKTEKTDEPAPVSARAYYKTFALKSPENKETFQNQRQIVVQIDISPQLRDSERIQLILDGKPYGKPAVSTALILDNIDRGEHSVSAQLIDKQGKVIRSTGSATIFIHYANLNTRAIIKAPVP